MLDSRTFGDFPAAIVLVAMINENGDDKNKNLLSQISKCTTEFNTILRELEKIDANIAISVVASIYPKYKRIAQEIPGKYGTYTANIVKSIHKQWRKSKNADMPKKKRNKITENDK